MSDNIIQLNKDLIKHDLKDLVRSSVEETLNALLDKEAITDERNNKLVWKFYKDYLKSTAYSEVSA